MIEIDDDETEALQEAAGFDFGPFVGRSAEMRQTYARLRRIAVVDSTVLVMGESGTGKELVAQSLHQAGSRRNGPLVAVNCAAVPASLVESELFGHVRGAFTGAIEQRQGRFEQADGGTLLIDEIGDFELGLQAKLLRVLETSTVTPVGGNTNQSVNVRVVAATSRDLPAMVHEGAFRADLFYRLNVICIHLPPLRDRPDDIPLLVRHFMDMLVIRRCLAPRLVSPELMGQLIAYRWPGNVRELRNTLEGMMVMADGETLTERDLPNRISDAIAAAAARPAPPAGVVPAGPAIANPHRAAIHEQVEPDADMPRARRAGPSVRLVAPAPQGNLLTLSVKQRRLLHRLLFRDLRNCSTPSLNACCRIGWTLGPGEGYELTTEGRRLAELSEQTPADCELRLDPSPSECKPLPIQISA